jgi:hypothetical protein
MKAEEKGKSVWVFDKTDKKKNYLACMYRMTFMVLVKELKNVSRCEVEYPKESTIPKSIVCKSE